MTIQGYVFNIETSEALIGARVTLLDEDGNKTSVKTQTDKSGFFFLDDSFIQSTDFILFEHIGFEKVKREATQLEDAKILMTKKVDFLPTNSNDADIPLSPTEELKETKNNTARNLLIFGTLVAVGIVAYYFSKNKKS
jgi:hypothetical protein